MTKEIKGYRKLTEVEIGLINDIKAMGEELEILCDNLHEYLEQQYEAARDKVVELKAESKNQVPGSQLRADQLLATRTVMRIAYAEPMNWLASGRTSFKVGLMALTRAVAQPNSF